MAPEVETFQPCAAPDALWVDGDPALVRVPRARYEELAREPYERTYAIVEGVSGPQLDCGFCEDYRGSFQIHRIVMQRRVGERDCQ